MNFKVQAKRKRRKGDAGQLAAQLAPLEEQDRAAANKQGSMHSFDQKGGAILVEKPKLPEGIAEDERKDFLGIEPVVLVIVVSLLLYIALIAWLISGLPPLTE